MRPLAREFREKGSMTHPGTSPRWRDSTRGIIVLDTFRPLSSSSGSNSSNSNNSNNSNSNRDVEYKKKKSIDFYLCSLQAAFLGSLSLAPWFFHAPPFHASFVLCPTLPNTTKPPLLKHPRLSTAPTPPASMSQANPNNMQNTVRDTII